jgi:hypothetical protein
MANLAIRDMERHLELVDLPEHIRCVFVQIDDYESMASLATLAHQNNDNLKYFAGCCFTSVTNVSNSVNSLSARM